MNKQELKKLTQQLLNIRKKLKSLNNIYQSKKLTAEQEKELQSLLTKAEEIKSQYQKHNYPTGTKTLENFLKRSRPRIKGIIKKKSRSGVGMFDLGGKMKTWN